MTDNLDLDAAALDAARSTLPIYVVAESPDGNVYSHSADFPGDDDTVWVGDNPADSTTMGDLYAQYGDDLIAYAEPEKVDAVAAALHAAGLASLDDKIEVTDVAAHTGVTAAQDAPKRTADGEVVINPDAPPDPKLALSEDAQQALNEIPGPRSDAEARGDDAAVAAWDRYAEALRSGKTPAEARKAGWPDGDAPAVTASLSAVEAEAALRQSLIDEGLDADAVERVLASGSPAVAAALCAPADIIRPGDEFDVLDNSPLPAAFEALDRIEGFLTDAEAVVGPVLDQHGIVAALGPVEGPLVPLPARVQRMAVGENPDAQATVVEAFEANYRDDVTEFIEDVLGSRPPDDTPDHDADAWDALAQEARVWHARRTGSIVAALLSSEGN